MNRKPVKGDTVEARAHQWFLEAIDFPPSPGTPIVAWGPGMMAMFAEAEIAKLRDSDAANLKVIQEARKALGLKPIGCQPGDAVDAGLVEEIRKLREDKANLLETIHNCLIVAGAPADLDALRLDMANRGMLKPGRKPSQFMAELIRDGKETAIRKAWMAAEERATEEMVNPWIPDSPTLDDYTKQELGAPETE